MDKPYLLLSKNGRSFALLKGAEYGLFLPLTAETNRDFQKLLKRWPCPLQELEGLKLPLSPFKTASLRGVVIKGYRRGDPLELWIGGDVRSYCLETDYSDEQLSDFFAPCLMVRQAPLRPDSSARDATSLLTIGLTLLALILSVVYAFSLKPQWLWSSLCILVQLVGLALPLLFPLRFTFRDLRPGEFHLGRGNLIFVPLFPGISLTLRMAMDFSLSGKAYLFLLGLSLGISLLVTAVIYDRFFRKSHRYGLCLGLWLLIGFLGSGTVAHLAALFGLI